MLFILQIATRKYRLQLPGFELPEAVATEQREFDDDLAQALDGMADRLEGRAPEDQSILDQRLLRLERTVQRYSTAAPPDTFKSQFQAFLLFTAGSEAWRVVCKSRCGACPRFRGLPYKPGRDDCCSAAVRF